MTDKPDASFLMMCSAAAAQKLSDMFQGLIGFLPTVRYQHQDEDRVTFVAIPNMTNEELESVLNKSTSQDVVEQAPVGDFQIENNILKISSLLEKCHPEITMASLLYATATEAVSQGMEKSVFMRFARNAWAVCDQMAYEYTTMGKGNG